MKKKIAVIILALIALLLSTSTVLADKPTLVDSQGIEIAWQPSDCTMIQSGDLVDNLGRTLETGFDQWGYNYQAHIFNGYYNNYTRPAVPVTSGDKLIMKWNDAWLANVDCSGDGKLDRYYGYSSYIGSGAWLTNEMSGVIDGMTWTYFVKIVAKPTADYDCVAVGGYSIWGAFCVIQEVNGGNPVLNEYLGGNGVTLKVEPAGFGAWQP